MIISLLIALLLWVAAYSYRTVGKELTRGKGHGKSFQ